MINYLRAHWRGEQPLLQSFWVNLVAVRALVFAVQSWLLADTDATSETAHGLSHGLIHLFSLLVHGIIFTWQIVGTWRSAERHVQTSGTQATLWGVQLMVVVFFWLTLSYAWEAWQVTRTPLHEADSMAANAIQPGYTLTELSEGKGLAIAGPIEAGITARLRTLLENSPSVTFIVLESSGGSIYEGRGLAALFKSNGLDTHVDKVCASACTLAYIGGEHRSVAEQAKLGFHQYRVESDYVIIATDPEREQVRDQQLFKDAGVDADFVDKMFDRESNAMWWPEQTELLNAGLVHTVSSGPNVGD